MERAKYAICEPLWQQTSIQPHYCPRLFTCRMMRSNRPSAAAVAHAPHARTLHANTETGVRAE
eukprot:11156900-Lingulodinium_polyedra.AAC.1